MIDLNKNLNTGQMLINFYEPMEIQKNSQTNQRKEVDTAVGTNVTVIQAA